METLQEIEQKAKDNTPNPETVWIDNAEFCQLLKISKRTSQNYRDRGIVDFSQIDSKVYYKLSDVYAMLEKHKRIAIR